MKIIDLQHTILSRLSGCNIAIERSKLTNSITRIGRIVYQWIDNGIHRRETNPILTVLNNTRAKIIQFKKK